MSAQAVKEPWMHIVKRDDISLFKAIGVRVIALVAALIVCALIIFGLTGLNPLSVYMSMFDGALGTSRRLWITLRDSAILLCVSLAVTPAFRMRFWNIGAEGQVLVGALATAAIMIYGGSLPAWQLFPLMIAGALAAGILWALLPAVFKAIWNTNETLFTLMMNYIAIQLVTYCIIFWENPKGSATVGLINKADKAGWLPAVFGNNYLITPLIVLGLMVILYVYLRYNKQGYEIAIVGESENTARYAGIDVKRVIIRTMALSGALCGVAGFLLVSGSSHTISTELAGGRGFTAIVVAWLGKLNPFIMLIVSFFLVFMEKGSIQIASQFNLNESASEIITGVILFFVLGCEFFINYRVEFRARRAKEGVKA